MKLINIPIEPLEDRYSKQWDGWFNKAFSDENSFTSVHSVYGGETSGKIKDGSFLDVVETNQYKLVQLQQLLKILPALKGTGETVVLFFHDLWFPGLEMIAYVRDGLGFKNLRITGCLHAGSYDPFDFLNKQKMTYWAADIENSWFGCIVDEIYVATHYHKKLLTDKRQVLPLKVKVTGFPIYPNSIILPDFKEDLIVFPHRLDSEKQPHLFDEAEANIINNWQWVKTQDPYINKAQYYETLKRSKIAVSFALQETWGIAMQEAVFAGAIPIVPYRLSYVEMYDAEFRYDTNAEAIELIYLYMRKPPSEAVLDRQRHRLIKAGKNAICNMIKHIKKL